jgi:hypothetical protein
MVDEKLDITELSVDGDHYDADRAYLILHHVNQTWGIESYVRDMPLGAYKSGDAVQVSFKLGKEQLTGEGRVLRAIGDRPLQFEVYSAGDLMKGEQVFEISKWEPPQKKS